MKLVQNLCYNEGVRDAAPEKSHAPTHGMCGDEVTGKSNKKRIQALIYLVIPAYNEEENIIALLDTIAVNLHENTYKIIVIDDGSTDHTPAILEEYGRRNDSIMVVTHENNIGIAQAFLSGFRHVFESAGELDTLALLEGDLTSDPSLLPGMIKKLESGYDVVVASRGESPGGYRGFPLMRLLLSRAANFFLSQISPSNVKNDYTIFYRAYRIHPLKALLEKYGDHLGKITGFPFNAALLLFMCHERYRIGSVPFLYDYRKKRGRSAMRIFSTVKEYFRLWRMIRTL